ncbi:urease accessory protein UreD [Megalodesulfovibrio paquesii]
MTMESASPERSWKARLSLGFEARPDRTVLRELDFRGPLRVQRTFYPEGAPCHCCILHPPGGLVSGDRLDIAVQVETGAHALLTTPSAGKIYGADSRNLPQEQHVRLQIRDGGRLEWLPMETIVFDRANAMTSLEISLEGRAVVLGWDIVCLGRPESAAPFGSGRLVQRLAIHCDGVPLLLERLALDAGGPVALGRFGLAGQPVLGTFFAAGLAEPAAQAALLAARKVLDRASPGVSAATFRRGVLLVRHCGASTLAARTAFEAVWQAIRPLVLDRPACPPRVWAT